MSVTWQLGYWDRGFESRSRHGCFSVSISVVLSCIDTDLATEWSLDQGVPPYV
jgi:hypothetical protein